MLDEVRNLAKRKAVLQVVLHQFLLDGLVPVLSPSRAPDNALEAGGVGIGPGTADVMTKVLQITNSQPITRQFTTAPELMTHYGVTYYEVMQKPG
jgi:hypothetical protein